MYWNWKQNFARPGVYPGSFLVFWKMNRRHRPLQEFAMRFFELPEKGRVLDVGCGGGANIATWLDKCRNGHVTGLDYSEVSVAESQELNAAAIKQGKCRVLQGDVSAIPFSDEVFDYVSAFETVYFWPGLKKCFSEVNRVLKSGGTFLICNESDGTNASD